MNSLQKHDPYPKPSYPLSALGKVVRETSPSWQQFDLMYAQCKAWQAARHMAEREIGLLPFPYTHPALAKTTDKAAIGRGVVSPAKHIPYRIASLIVIKPRHKVRYTLTLRPGYGIL